MTHSSIPSWLAGLGLACAALAAAPLSAETLEELDAMSDITAREDTGIAAAREQAGRGEYLEALSTLERVLAAFPESREARLIHAVYLCDIDDNQGGLVELGELDEKDYDAQTLATARARCASSSGNQSQSGRSK